jgi:phytoene dehydrogenase-like protein
VNNHDFDALVVGSGPNGLAAAITLQQAGLSVLLIEGKKTIGGGLRSGELTLPGFTHDICSAIHPLAAGSPFFTKLPLHEHGLEYIYPTLAAAHPFDDGNAAVLDKSLEHTAHMLGKDERTYLRLFTPLVKQWTELSKDILGPLHFPDNPILLARFGLQALQSGRMISAQFSTDRAKGLWAGMTAHSMLPLSKLSSAAIGFVLMTAAHVGGWPIPRGGSHAIANALASYFKSIGGKIQTDFLVTSLDQLPSAKTIIFDLSPKSVLEIAGHKFSSIYKWQLNRYRYGMGVFKMDWALSEPIPFKAEACKLAGTVHIGGTFREIAASELSAWKGRHSERPYILTAQQSLFDPTRVPAGKQTVWAYCHVPKGSTKDMSAIIERQIERFAPGFKDCILQRSSMNCAQMEEYNPNYIGGDINGGAIDISQLFTRPALRLSPYRTSAKGIYLCSASTPPGGGVHGMCGYHAADRALKDMFNKKALTL